MTRRLMAPALALGAVLAAGDAAVGQDTGPARAGVGGTTMTLGGKGTIAAAATAADDTELTWCRRGGWGGWGWGGGCRWGGCGWGGGWGPGWGGGWNACWTPAFRPVVFSSVSFARPAWGGGWGGSWGGWNAGWGGGWNTWNSGWGWQGISGGAADAAAPVVSLAMTVAKNPLVARPAGAPAGPPANGFRYDGGPASPVPLPKPDASPKAQAAPAAPGLPVSLKSKKPASPYTYKAYGEK